MAERRDEGIELLKAGKKTQVEIARHLSVSEAAVSQWKKKLITEGPEALRPRRATGRPPRLDDEAKQALIRKLPRSWLSHCPRSTTGTIAGKRTV